MPSSLHLITSDPPSGESEAMVTRVATTPVGESSELHRTRMERDAALEELAFIREQLRSTEAFYAHRFELEYARLYAEHRGFLEQLTRLSVEFHRRAQGDDPREDASSTPSDPPEVSLLPRER